MSKIQNKHRINGQFVAVTFDVLHISKYAGKKFSASEKILYRFLYMLGKNVEKVYPNVTYLCEIMGVERRATMLAQLKSLEGKGLIEVIREGGKSNVYHVNEINEELCSYPDKIVLNKGTNQDPTRGIPVTHTSPTQTSPEPLQQAPRPCEIKPSDSAFEDDMLATESLVKPERVSCGVRGVSMEDFIDGNVDMTYSEFLKHYAKVGLDENMLTDKARELYREHILEEATGIPF